MKLSGRDYKLIHTAILSGYPDKNSLEQMLLFRLEVRLSEITDGNNSSEIIFNLVKWAESTGNLEQLILGAKEENPGNRKLQRLVNEYLHRENRGPLIDAPEDYQSEQPLLVEERLQALESSIVRTVKWYEKETSRLSRQLSDLLVQQKVTKENLVSQAFSDDNAFNIAGIRAEVKSSVAEVLNEMLAVEFSAEDDRHTDNHLVDDSDSLIYLEMGKGFAVSGDWLNAAEYYGKYVENNIEDWEVHFLRGVSYANTRLGNETNLSGLRSYNEAIAYVPYDVDVNVRARLFGYRAAIAKRLNRLDEAEADLLLAQKYAAADYEIFDIKYNLAAVYAMQGKKTQMLSQIHELSNRPDLLMNIRWHIRDYFEAYSDDDDFLAAVNGV